MSTLDEKKLALPADQVGFTRLVVGISIGRKVVMALSGLGLIAFLVLHLAGNALALRGADVINEYSHILHTNSLLPLFELLLALTFLTHIVFGITTVIFNWRARPTSYARKVSAGADPIPSSTVVITAAILLAYILVHVFEMVFGPHSVEPAFDLVRHVFGSSWNVAFYSLGFCALALHLSHGIPSAFFTLGLRHPKHDRWIMIVSITAAVLLALGFGSILLWYVLRGGA